MKPKKKKTILWISILILCMLVVTIMGYQSTHTNKRTIVDLGGDGSISQEASSDIRYEANEKEVNIDYDFATSHFDEDLKTLEQVIAENKGIIRNSNLGTERDKKSTYMFVRIPRENNKTFEKSVEAIGKLISKSTSIDGLDEAIKDNELELQTKENELAAYQKLMENAQSIEDITKLQEKISNLITQINNLKTSKSLINSKANYTDYEISLRDMADADLGLEDSPQVIQSVVKAVKESIYLLKLFIVIVATTFVRFWWLLLGILFGTQVVKEYRKKKKLKETPTDNNEKKE